MACDSTYSLIVRLPSETEFWYSDELPLVGSTITCHGRPYEVTASESKGDHTFVVTVIDEDRRRDVGGVPAAAA